MGLFDIYSKLYFRIKCLCLLPWLGPDSFCSKRFLPLSRLPVLWITDVRSDNNWTHCESLVQYITRTSKESLTVWYKSSTVVKASQAFQWIVWCASSIILIPNVSLCCFIYFGLTPLLLPGSPNKEEQERDLKAALKGTDPSIPLVFVSGNHDLGNTPTPSSVEQYCNNWGDDYFSFWVNRHSINYISRKWMGLNVKLMGLNVKLMALSYLWLCPYMLNLFSSLQFKSHTVM